MRINFEKKCEKNEEKCRKKPKSPNRMKFSEKFSPKFPLNEDQSQKFFCRRNWMLLRMIPIVVDKCFIIWRLDGDFFLGLLLFGDILPVFGKFCWFLESFAVFLEVLLVFGKFCCFFWKFCWFLESFAAFLEVLLLIGKSARDGCDAGSAGVARVCWYPSLRGTKQSSDRQGAGLLRSSQ
jgi:hypothetical protein